MHRREAGKLGSWEAGRHEGWEAGKPEGKEAGKSRGRGNVGLGHRRLSIIDLETGDQPMASPDGSIQVVFNGEIYNFLELKKELEARGCSFRTRSDTETIIWAYLEWGEDFVHRLNGMFAIGLWDERRGKLVLVRDRIGKKPLYYAYEKNSIAFASELKALLKVPGMSREIESRAVDAYFSFGYVPSPMSIFKGVKKLAPAALAVITPDGFRQTRYWDLAMTGDIGPDQEERVLEELADLFDDCVQKRMISDVPLGAFLSGGVDSSAVVAAMAGMNPGEAVRTAAIGFSEKRFNELAFARQVAERYKTDHHEFTVQPDALEVLERIVRHFDEPFADASAVPTYYVSKMARQNVTVALSGDGGDEVFAGYAKRYAMVRFEDRIRSSIPPLLQKGLLGPLSRLYPRLDNMPRPLRLKTFLANLSMSLEEAYPRDMSFYFSPELKKGLYQGDFAGALDGSDTFGPMQQALRQVSNADALTRAQFADIQTYLPEDILVKVDRMSMAHSLEVRAPILDHRIFEYAARLSPDYKLKGRESKYILKKMNEGRVPRDCLYRSKQGFNVPVAAWLRGEIKEMARDLLISPVSGLKDFVRPAAVHLLWERHQGGREDNSNQLWNLMMFEMWRRAYA